MDLKVDWKLGIVEPNRTYSGVLNFSSAPTKSAFSSTLQFLTLFESYFRFSKLVLKMISIEKVKSQNLSTTNEFRAENKFSRQKMNFEPKTNFRDNK